MGTDQHQSILLIWCRRISLAHHSRQGFRDTKAGHPCSLTIRLDLAPRLVGCRKRNTPFFLEPENSLKSGSAYRQALRLFLSLPKQPSPQSTARRQNHCLLSLYKLRSKDQATIRFNGSPSFAPILTHSPPERAQVSPTDPVPTIVSQALVNLSSILQARALLDDEDVSSRDSTNATPTRTPTRTQGRRSALLVTIAAHADRLMAVLALLLFDAHPGRVARSESQSSGPAAVGLDSESPSAPPGPLHTPALRARAHAVMRAAADHSSAMMVMAADSMRSRSRVVVTTAAATAGSQGEHNRQPKNKEDDDQGRGRREKGEEKEEEEEEEEKEDKPRNEELRHLEAVRVWLEGSTRELEELVRGVYVGLRGNVREGWWVDKGALMTVASKVKEVLGREMVLVERLGERLSEGSDKVIRLSEDDAAMLGLPQTTVARIEQWRAGVSG
ncbi:hypothetical protein VTI28DRAFT_2107 [Corynascus sepedonium]